MMPENALASATLSSASRRLNVAILCSTCDGQDVGEPWSSYQWVKGLSEFFNVTLLTYKRPGHLSASEQLPNVEVVEWPDFPVLGNFERFSAGVKPGWWLLYWRARRWLKRELAHGRRFDLAHQLSPLALRHASPLSSSNLPYILGPLAGGLEAPSGFRREIAAGETLFRKMRRVDPTRLRFDPILRRGYEQASVVIGVAPYVLQNLRSVKLKRFELMSETGVLSLPTWDRHEKSNQGGKLRVLFVGRIVRTKGVRDLIRSVAKLPNRQEVHVDVVGEGDDLQACRKEAQELSVSDAIQFHGRQPRSRVDDFYRSADLFVFPSVREPSGNVVFEAMSFGLPVVCSCVGGPAQLVTEECGVKIEPVEPGQYAQEIANTIGSLCNDREKLRSMGRKARERVDTVGLWENKIQWMKKLYEEVANGSDVP